VTGRLPSFDDMPASSTDQSIGVSVLDLIGRTPLIRLRHFERETPGVQLYAKVEGQNPGGSVKDRAAARMIADGEASGRLVPGRRILDATSGNTGIAYAMIGAAKGYGVTLCVPDNASPERKRILRAFGADLILTSPLESTDGAIREARRIYALDPGRYFYPDQYNNDANWRAHYDTTGAEIIEQTSGRITHFVAGLGTGGTFIGTGRRLRHFNPSIRLISFQPDSPFHGLEGLKHMESAIVPGIYDPSLADEDLRVDSERAYGMVKRLAREEGVLAGISSGAALVATLEVASRLREGVVVTVFPDGAEKYLTEKFWTADG
jgi:cysteine synthase B